MADKKQITREDILNALDLNRVTQDDIVAIVDRMVDFLNAHAETSKGTIEEIRTILRDELSNNTTTEFGSIKSQLNQLLGNTLTRLEDHANGLVARVEASVAAITNGLDGKDADPELVTQEVLKRIVIPTAEDVMNGVPALGERTRDSLELLPEGEKLVIDAIEGLRKELDALRKLKGKEVLLGGGPHYLAGTNVTIDGNVISATGGAGGGVGAWSTPAESVDGTTTVFTTTTPPTDVVADGITLFPNLGYTYAAGQITLTNAPQIYVKFR